MYKFSWNTRGFSSERSKSPAANTEPALCPTSESADKVEVALLEYRYRFYGSSCTVRTELRLPPPSSLPPSSLPFVPRGKWAARIFHAVPPHVFREKFAETKVIEVNPLASWLASFLHTSPIRRKINSPPTR